MNTEEQLKELQAKLQAEQEAHEKTKKTLEQATSKGLKLKEENLTLKEEIMLLEELPPELKAEHARMKFMLKQAEQFINSGAFPKGMKPEQALVLMKAGKELGLSELQALNDLYIVNGHYGFHSAGLVNRVVSNGYVPSYTDEDEKGVTVTLTKDAEGFNESYRVNRNDPHFQGSNAIKGNPKNKMRYHGIRMIVNFHIPQIVGPVPVWEEDDYNTKQLPTSTHKAEAIAFEEQAPAEEVVEEVNEVQAEETKENERGF